MLGPVHKSESPYQRNLKQIARIAQYEPVASIPQPSQGFNYTVIRNRYSDYYDHEKIMKKPKPNQASMKLTTILETQGKSPLFPKINKARRSPEQLDSSRKKLKGLRSYFHNEGVSTNASRERSLTIDTRLDTEQDLLTANDNIRGVSEFKSVDKSYSVAPESSQKVRAVSPGSELSLLISRRRYGSPVGFNRSTVDMVQSVNQQQQEYSSDEQFQKEAVPGPGSYTYSYSDFDKARNTGSTNVSFLTKDTRFRYPLPPPQEPHHHQRDPIQKELEEARQRRFRQRPKKKQVPFNSRSPRKFEADELAKRVVPGPENYFPRLGIEEDLIRSIQRNFKGNFGSGEARSIDPKVENPHLGPGYYQGGSGIDLSSENFYFKSQKPRFE